MQTIETAPATAQTAPVSQTWERDGAGRLVNTSAHAQTAPATAQNDAAHDGSAAAYNITTDKLFLRPADRLNEADYAACKAAGFTWWPGSKQFVAKWNPEAEDFALKMAGTVADDDTPDDAEARVNRFAGYAQRAETAADSSADYLAERANTERRRENALNAISRNLSEAEHWQARIAGAIRHAAHKERPDVIARRIKGLEADLRKKQREADWKENYRIIGNLRDFYLCDEAGEPVRNEAGKVRLDHAKIEAKHAPMKQWAGRWIAHLENRLLYERAMLEAAGGIAADSKLLEVGGAIKARWQSNGEWALISKVNKVSVEIRVPGSADWDGTVRNVRYKVPLTDVKSVMTRAEVETVEDVFIRRPVEAVPA